MYYALYAMYRHMVTIKPLQKYVVSNQFNYQQEKKT